MDFVDDHNNKSTSLPVVTRLQKIQENFDKTQLLSKSDLDELKDLRHINAKHPLVEHLIVKLYNGQFASKPGVYFTQCEDSDSTIDAANIISLLKNSHSALINDQQQLFVDKISHLLKRTDDSARVQNLTLVKCFAKYGQQLIAENARLKSALINYLKEFDPFSSLVTNEPNYENLYIFNKYMKCMLLYLSEFDLVEKTVDNLLKSHLIERLEILKVKGILYETIYLKSLVLMGHLVIRLDVSKIGQIIDQILTIVIKLDEIYLKLDDDVLIDFNLACLNQHLLTRRDDNSSGKLITGELKLDPHKLFCGLIATTVKFNYELIIDWLLSNETKFLVYFLKYLKYLNSELNLKKTHLIDELDDILAQNKTSTTEYFQFLNQVYTKLNKLKRSFPYNIQPLLKLLTSINELIITVK